MSYHHSNSNDDKTYKYLFIQISGQVGSRRRALSVIPNYWVRFDRAHFYLSRIINFPTKYDINRRKNKTYENMKKKNISALGPRPPSVNISTEQSKERFSIERQHAGAISIGIDDRYGGKRPTSRKLTSGIGSVRDWASIQRLRWTIYLLSRIDKCI